MRSTVCQVNDILPFLRGHKRVDEGWHVGGLWKDISLSKRTVSIFLVSSRSSFWLHAQNMICIGTFVDPMDSNDQYTVEEKDKRSYLGIVFLEDWGLTLKANSDCLSLGRARVPVHSRPPLEPKQANNLEQGTSMARP